MKLRINILMALSACGFLLVMVAGAASAQDAVPGNPVLGGQMYDNWYNVLDADPPVGDHPLWNSDNELTSGAKTWRCAECHGWDYQGEDGAYSSGDHYTGIPGVQNAIGMNNQEIMSWLNGEKDPRHNFTPYINPSAMTDLVAFLRTKQVNYNLLVDYESHAALGNKLEGKVLYEDTCQSCHGENGEKQNFASAANPSFLGDISWVDPWQTIHKIRFGQTNTLMPAAENLGWNLQDVANVLAYLQTMPSAHPIPDFASRTINQTELDNQGNIITIIIATSILFVFLVGLAIYSRVVQKKF